MIRDRKTLLYSNIRDLSEEEKNKLSDLGLNCCDRCGDVDDSERLYWLDYYYEQSVIPENMRKFTALCDRCHDALKSKKKKAAKPSDGKNWETKCKKENI